MKRLELQSADNTRLTRQHFALYRGYLDGVSEAQLHASYGDTGADVRSTRRLIAVLRDTLSVLARRAHDTEAAYLLRLRPGSIPPPGAAVSERAPSLDEFRERVDPDNVYGEAELLALYQETFPPGASPALDRRAARNTRLRRRQAEALARMEANLAQDPKPEHPVEGWLEPALARRLTEAGLVTIGDVIASVEARRHRWYTGVPRLGPKGAQRVVDWLGLHAQALRHALSDRALVPRRQWTGAISHRSTADADALCVAPLEALRVPVALDGSKGSNRGRISTSAYSTDIRAITAWLDARAGNEHTRRAYRREAERLVLWALIEKKKAFSSLDSADCAEYIGTFLADPQPAARWVRRGRVERCLAAWRPFAGPLSDRSRESARAILTALCAWLIEVNFLANNPFAGIGRASEPPVFQSVGRTLDVEQWKIVLESTVRENYSFVEHRDRLTLLLAYATGLRRAELAAATADGLSVGRVRGVAGPVWRLDVASESGKTRTVLLPPAVIQAMQENFAMRGMPDPLACPENTPILAQARTGRAISPDGIGRIIKQIFAAATTDCATRGMQDLMRASTHWLRHTHSVHALSHGAELGELSAALGHASLATTSLYASRDEASRFLGVEALIRATSGARKVYAKG